MLRPKTLSGCYDSNLKGGAGHIKSMKTRRFTVQVVKSPEGGYTGRCLELPAAISEADTIEQLEPNMREVITLVLEAIEEKTRLNQKITIEIPN